MMSSPLSDCDLSDAIRDEEESHEEHVVEDEDEDCVVPKPIGAGTLRRYHRTGENFRIERKLLRSVLIDMDEDMDTTVPFMVTGYIIPRQSAGRCTEALINSYFFQKKLDPFKLVGMHPSGGYFLGFARVQAINSSADGKMGYVLKRCKPPKSRSIEFLNEIRQKEHISKSMQRAKGIKRPLSKRQIAAIMSKRRRIPREVDEDDE